MSTIHMRFFLLLQIEWYHFGGTDFLLCGSIRWLSQSLLLLTWKTTWHAPPPISSMLYVRPAEAYQLTISPLRILIEEPSFPFVLWLVTSSTLLKAHSWCPRWDTSWRIAKKTWNFSRSGLKRVSSPVSLYAPTDHYPDLQCRIFRVEKNHLLETHAYLLVMPSSQNVVEKPIVHVTYTEAVDVLLKAKKKFEFPVCPSCL